MRRAGVHAHVLMRAKNSYKKHMLVHAFARQKTKQTKQKTKQPYGADDRAGVHVRVQKLIQELI